MVFEAFDDSARRTVVLAQEEARLLRHGDIGADHLLVAVARVDEAILAVAPERLRDAMNRARGPHGPAESPSSLPFTAEAKRALELAAAEASRLGHPRVVPGHLLLGLLNAGDTTAGLLAQAGVSRDAAAAGAERAAAQPPSLGAPGPPALRRVGLVPALDDGRFEDAVREGHPVMVRLHDAPPLGDIGSPQVDARLLRIIIAADGRLARLLHAHGITEAAIDAALQQDS